MNQLRNISNFEQNIYPQNPGVKFSDFEKKIIHELDNQGCKCRLCQKVVLNEMRIVKRVDFNDIQSEHTKGKKQEYLTQFLTQYFYIDKMNRKLRVLLPQMCIFEKGNPTCLLTKKKDILPLKLLKNKQKMNAFEIHKFFMDGYIYHNQLKQNQEIMRNHKVTTLKKQYYKFDQYLKNECIVLVKFLNGSCQMMTPVQLNSLFKSKQKLIRQDILYIQTMACTQHYKEIRVHIDLKGTEYHLAINDLYERAKNQVKMMNENIRPKDFLFVMERDQRKFEEQLKKKQQKEYLRYLGLKFLLVYSLRTDILMEKCLFKFIKDSKTGNYYLIDLQVYQKGTASKLWGQFEKKKAQSPTKNPIKRRPASSPDKLQSCKVPKGSHNQQNLQIQLKKLVIQANDTENFINHAQNHKQSRSQIRKVEQRIKSNSLFKLQPIKRNSQRTKRLMSSLITNNNEASRMLKRFL